MWKILIIIKTILLDIPYEIEQEGHRRKNEVFNGHNWIKKENEKNN